MDDSEDKSKPDWYFVFLVAFLLLTCISWVITSEESKYLLNHVFTKDNMGTYGDSFGGFTSLFSALALWALLLTLYYQRKEFDETRKVLKQTADAQEMQTKKDFLFYELDEMKNLSNYIKDKYKQGTNKTYQLQDAYYHCYALFGINSITEEIVHLNAGTRDTAFRNTTYPSAILKDFIDENKKEILSIAKKHLAGEKEYEDFKTHLQSNKTNYNLEEVLEEKENPAHSPDTSETDEGNNDK